MKNRIWEIDFFRGIALIFMIYFHIIFDLDIMYGYNVSYNSTFNYLTGKLAAVLFIFISGISCSFSSNNIKRSLKILIAAAFISAGTFIFIPELWVKFGILHFLGASILLFYPLRKMKPVYLAVIGLIILAAGMLVDKITVSHDYLFFLGITTGAFQSGDYYPIIPWFGIFLIGVAAGKTFYAGKKSLFRFNMRPNIISKLGRHTLLIYMLHQPVIIAVLNLVFKP